MLYDVKNVGLKLFFYPKKPFPVKFHTFFMKGIFYSFKIVFYDLKLLIL
jgi:hypothetical protein